MSPPGCSLGSGKKIQNYSCRRLTLARIYHNMRIWVPCSSKAREVQVMSSFENNQSDIDVCVSLSTLCILPKITHNYNMSLLKNTNSGPMFLLSAAFRLQLKCAILPTRWLFLPHLLFSHTPKSHGAHWMSVAAFCLLKNKKWQN
jgi:hypothetical protein